MQDTLYYSEYSRGVTLRSCSVPPGVGVFYDHFYIEQAFFACASIIYLHVHLCAHGATRHDPYERRFLLERRVLFLVMVIAQRAIRWHKGHMVILVSQEQNEIGFSSEPLSSSTLWDLRTWNKGSKTAWKSVSLWDENITNSSNPLWKGRGWVLAARVNLLIY